MSISESTTVTIFYKFIENATLFHFVRFGAILLFAVLWTFLHLHSHTQFAFTSITNSVAPTVKCARNFTKCLENSIQTRTWIVNLNSYCLPIFAVNLANRTVFSYIYSCLIGFYAIWFCVQMQSKCLTKLQIEFSHIFRQFDFGSWSRIHAAAILFPLHFIVNIILPFACMRIPFF